MKEAKKNINEIEVIDHIEVKASMVEKLRPFVKWKDELLLLEKAVGVETDKWTEGRKILVLKTRNPGSRVPMIPQALIDAQEKLDAHVKLMYKIKE